MLVSLNAPIVISLGAIAGALCRYYITLFFAQRLGSTFSYGTFFVNLSGCLVMGFVVALTAERVSLSPDFKLMIITGFLGAYTTFSTYELDTFNHMRQGRSAIALFYWLGSAVLGVVCIQIGAWLGGLGRS